MYCGRSRLPLAALLTVRLAPCTQCSVLIIIPLSLCLYNKWRYTKFCTYYTFVHIILSDATSGTDGFAEVSSVQRPSNTLIGDPAVHQTGNVWILKGQDWQLQLASVAIADETKRVRKYQRLLARGELPRMNYFARNPICEGLGKVHRGDWTSLHPHT